MTTYVPKTIEYEHAACDTPNCTTPLERIGNGYPVAWMLDHSHPFSAICDACCTGYCRECGRSASTDGRDATEFTNGWLLTLDAAGDWSLAEDLFTYAESLDEWIDVPVDYIRTADSVMAVWLDHSAVLFRRFTESGKFHQAGDLTGEYLVLAPAEAEAIGSAPPSMVTKWASDDPEASVVGVGGAVGWAHATVCFGCERDVRAVFTDDELDDDLCAACYTRDYHRRDN